jgi:hypothetical protein
MVDTSGQTEMTTLTSLSLYSKVSYVIADVSTR